MFIATNTFLSYILCAALIDSGWERQGRILEPFIGGGSTIAAAEYVGYTSVGVEFDEHYYDLAVNALLANLYKGVNTSQKMPTASADPIAQQISAIPATEPLAPLLHGQLF